MQSNTVFTRAIREDRRRRLLTWGDYARAAGVSLRTLHNALAGRPLQELTRERIERMIASGGRRG